MSHVPDNLKYTSTHEWVQLESDGSVRVGITEYAQQLLGDMVYVELPEVDREVKQGAEIGVVESVKAAADLYSPLSGKILSINPLLNTQPELLNQDPYQAGWIFQLMPADTQEITQLLDTVAYQHQINTEKA